MLGIAVWRLLHACTADRTAKGTGTALAEIAMTVYIAPRLALLEHGIIREPCSAWPNNRYRISSHWQLPRSEASGFWAIKGHSSSGWHLPVSLFSAVRADRRGMRGMHRRRNGQHCAQPNKGTHRMRSLSRHRSLLCKSGYVLPYRVARTAREQQETFGAKSEQN